MATTVMDDRRTSAKTVVRDRKANQKTFAWILAAVIVAGLIVFFAARRTADNAAISAPTTMEETDTMNNTVVDPVDEPGLDTEMNAVSPGQNPDMPVPTNDMNPSPTSPANPVNE